MSSHPNPNLRNWLVAGFVLALLAHSLALAQPSTAGATDSDLKNWFNDPFFQFTAAVADCPVPLGPLLKENESAAETIRRAGRGAHCQPGVNCVQPNTSANPYTYDADIAKALKAALEVNQLYTHSPLVNSSLWATVQGRIVKIEGCMAGDAYTPFNHDMITTQIENVAKAIPNVLQAVVRVRTSGQTRAGAALPYRVRP